MKYGQMNTKQRDEVHQEIMLQHASPCKTCTHTYCPNYTPSETNPAVVHVSDRIEHELSMARQLARQHGLMLTPIPTPTKMLGNIMRSTVFSTLADKLPEDSHAKELISQLGFTDTGLDDLVNTLLK